jgi:hypothetical protein
MIFGVPLEPSFDGPEQAEKNKKGKNTNKKFFGFRISILSIGFYPYQ